MQLCNDPLGAEKIIDWPRQFSDVWRMRSSESRLTNISYRITFIHAERTREHTFFNVSTYVLVAPPTKEGKNNGYRQTNARTVNIIRYIKFFDGPVKKWH